MIRVLRFKLLFLLLFFSMGAIVFSQIDELDVETGIKRVSKDEFILIFDFSIEEDWHLYCQHNPEEASQAIIIEATVDGQTDFKFIKEKNGAAHRESKHHKEFSGDFGVNQTFFSDEARIKQRIKILNKKVKKIKITLSGQVCNTSCLPYEQEFEFRVSKKKKKKKKKESNRRKRRRRRRR